MPGGVDDHFVSTLGESLRKPTGVPFGPPDERREAMDGERYAHRLAERYAPQEFVVVPPHSNTPPSRSRSSSCTAWREEDVPHAGAAAAAAVDVEHPGSNVARAPASRWAPSRGRNGKCLFADLSRSPLPWYSSRSSRAEARPQPRTSRAPIPLTRWPRSAIRSRARTTPARRHSSIALRTLGR